MERAYGGYGAEMERAGVQKAQARRSVAFRLGISIRSIGDCMSSRSDSVTECEKLGVRPTFLPPLLPCNQQWQFNNDHQLYHSCACTLYLGACATPFLAKMRPLLRANAKKARSRSRGSLRLAVRRKVRSSVRLSPRLTSRTFLWPYQDGFESRVGEQVFFQAARAVNCDEVLLKGAAGQHTPGPESMGSLRLQQTNRL